MSKTPDSEFIIFVAEQLESLGNLAVKRMFGGYSLSLNGISFALAFEDEIYFKVDDTNRAKYEKHGSKPFSYAKQGKEIIISNWSVPIDIIEDQEQLMLWAAESYEIAYRKKNK